MVETKEQLPTKPDPFDQVDSVGFRAWLHKGKVGTKFESERLKCQESEMPGGKKGDLAGYKMTIRQVDGQIASITISKGEAKAFARFMGFRPR